MAWFPKLSCHAGAQVEFIGLMKKLLVKFCNLWASHKAQPGDQTSPKSIRGESCRIWDAPIPNFSRPLVFFILLLFAGRMKVKISMAKKQKSRKSRTSLDFTRESSGSCGTLAVVAGPVSPAWCCHTPHLTKPGLLPQFLLSLHILLIKHHLPLRVPFPSAWVSGVGPNSFRTSFFYWWLPMAGKWGSLVSLY